MRPAAAAAAMSFSSMSSFAAAGRSSRPRPLSFPGIDLAVGGTGHLCLRRFPLCPPGNGEAYPDGRGGGRTGGDKGKGKSKSGDADTEDEASVEEHTNPIGAETERSHSHGNINSQTVGIRLHLQTMNTRMEGNLSQLDNDQTTITNNLAMIKRVLARMDKNQITITNVLAQMVATSSTNSPHVSENEGLLNFISVFTKIVFMLKSCLVTFSVMYPGSQKALVQYDDARIQVICFINLGTWLAGSILLLPFAAHFKGSKSINSIGFAIFMGTVFLWWLVCVVEYCVTLHVYLQIKNSVVWPTGIAVFFLTLFSSVAYIEAQRPTVVSKWAKAMWKKITGCSLFQKINSLRLRSRDLPVLSGA